MSTERLVFDWVNPGKNGESGSTARWLGPVDHKRYARLAQLVVASALHALGREFEPLTAHHFSVDTR